MTSRARVLLLGVASVACGAVVAVGVRAWYPATPDQDVAASAGPESSPAPGGRTRAPTASPSPGMRSSTPLRAGPTGRGARTRHVFPVSGCPVSYGGAHHDYPATDVFAARGCLVVSPVAGQVDEVGRVDRWTASTNDGRDRGGLFVSVVGADGVRYYGAHLEVVLPRVRPGLQVSAGTPLGRVGDTGSAAGTGTHLHVGLSWPTPPGYWWVRRGTVPPARFLDAWRAGRDLSPVRAVLRARAAYGDDSRCHAYC